MIPINQLLVWFSMGNNKNYKGVERRNHERRNFSDRREVVRFEDKLGRRSGQDRRMTG